MFIGGLVFGSFILNDPFETYQQKILLLLLFFLSTKANDSKITNYKHPRFCFTNILDPSSSPSNFLKIFLTLHKVETAIWSHLLKKSAMENFIFLCSVTVIAPKNFTKLLSL